MTEPARRVRRAEILAALPPPWPHDPFPAIAAAVRASRRKVVVLDDDPTGTQTVHGIPVLTEWSVAALRAELQNDLPAFYLLTNSRSLPPVRAQALSREIGASLQQAARQAGECGLAVISRGDSTLRGHFPGETDALAEALGGGFDATLLVPAFFDGGRYTIQDVQYVAENSGGEEWLAPAGETEFARDAAFGYRASNLRHWVEEKTQGRVPADAVASLSLDTLRRGGPDAAADLLLNLDRGAVCIVNAAAERDLAVATLGALRAEARGQRRFLYRTAASFVPLRAAIERRPLLTGAELSLAGSGGLVVVGSYVPRTSAQVESLVSAVPGIQTVEVRVPALLREDADREVLRAAGAAEDGLRRGKDVVVYTSRALVAGPDGEQSLTIGRRISEGLVAVVGSIETRPRYLLAKGGITSSDLATWGLGVRRALVLGQIAPGVPVWRLGPETRFPGLPYIVFPGNVGAPDALSGIVARLR